MNTAQCKNATLCSQWYLLLLLKAIFFPISVYVKP